MNKYEIVTLRSGVKSLRELTSGETFHPVTGPWIEANLLHVGQQRIVERAKKVKKFVLWDVGLGAAGNALAAVEAFREVEDSTTMQIEIHSFDRSISPLQFALQNAETLEYLVPYQGTVKNLLQEGRVQPFPHLEWYFHLGEFSEILTDARIAVPHSIFYDPYSPGQNTEMWTLSAFSQLRLRLGNHPCLLSNYTCSTAVRVTLLLAGFFVGQGMSIGEKRETTVAATQLDLLESPLGLDWLERVKISGNAAPLRESIYAKRPAKCPIDEADFRWLVSLPQFFKEEDL